MPLDGSEWDYFYHDKDCPAAGRIHVRVGHWALCLRPDGIHAVQCHWPYSRHGAEGHWACRDRFDFFCAQDGCPNSIDKTVLVIEMLAHHPEYAGMLKFDGDEQREFEDGSMDPVYGWRANLYLPGRS